MSKIERFNTQHVSNYLDQKDSASYAAWMHASSGFPLEGSVKTAKRVLGRQSYCWNGNYRNWIWEDEFTFVDNEGNNRECRWRLFASLRGFSLEVEDKYDRPHGLFIRQAAYHGFRHFLEAWKLNDSNYDCSKYNQCMSIYGY